VTAFQLYMLDYLRQRGAGAVRVAGLWLWPEDVRRDARLAERVYWVVAR